MRHLTFTRRWHTRCAEETQALGAFLGAQAMIGDCVVCRGPLGSGKTTFVQGFARGLGVPDEEYVRSPTFALMHQYDGRFPLYHCDFYRLADISELDNIGFMDESLAPGVFIIEWGDKFPTALPENCLEVQLQVLSPERRLIYGTAYEQRSLRYCGVSLPPLNLNTAVI